MFSGSFGIFRTEPLRMTRSPRTMGVEWPKSDCTFQRMFSFVLPSQVNGRSVSSVWPERLGPRHCGQSAAVVGATEQVRITRPHKARIAERAARWVFMFAEPRRAVAAKRYPVYVSRTAANV